MIFLFYLICACFPYTAKGILYLNSTTSSFLASLSLYGLLTFLRHSSSLSSKFSPLSHFDLGLILLVVAHSFFVFGLGGMNDYKFIPSIIVLAILLLFKNYISNFLRRYTDLQLNYQMSLLYWFSFLLVFLVSCASISLDLHSAIAKYFSLVSHLTIFTSIPLSGSINAFPVFPQNIQNRAFAALLLML